ncbi:hypothetical protein DPMN_106837 [Dreissena polymorpha]|uniref:Uncharacterized protein n=1 Tax=Dreissena polymorpha TaxID=45954 RepID=A0A9D4K5N1_DREPO|nr:hypothetical protein DPMN_106837 [Dreissena polymorpha]
MPPDTLSRLAMAAQCHLTHYQGWGRLNNATLLTIKAGHDCTLSPDSLPRIALRWTVLGKKFTDDLKRHGAEPWS